MKLFGCRGCEVLEREVERLHRQLQRATDLLAEKHAPGTSQRVPHAMPLPPTPKTSADGKRYIPQLRREEDVFPGYEPEVTTEMVEFVEPGED
jgi:hypothetical protein